MSEQDGVEPLFIHKSEVDSQAARHQWVFNLCIQSEGLTTH